jgi:hypothetical protein
VCRLMEIRVTTDSQMRSLNVMYWIFLQKLIVSQLVKITGFYVNQLAHCRAQECLSVELTLEQSNQSSDFASLGL